METNNNANTNNSGKAVVVDTEDKVDGGYPNIARMCRETVDASKPACDKLDGFVRSLAPGTALDVVKRCLECTIIQPNSTWLLRDLLSRTVWDNLFEVVLSVHTRDECLAALNVPSTECVAFETSRTDGVLDTFLCRVTPQLRMDVASQVVQSGAPSGDWHTRGNFYSDPVVLYDMVYESGLRRFCQRLSNDLLMRVCTDATRKERGLMAHQIERERTVDLIVKATFGKDEIACRAAHDALKRTPTKQPRRGMSMLETRVPPPPMMRGQQRTCLRALGTTMQPIPLEL